MPWVNRRIHIHTKSIKHRKQTPNTAKTPGIQKYTNIITKRAMKLEKCKPNPRKEQETYGDMGDEE
jgi:hypothetical protein